MSNDPPIWPVEPIVDTHEHDEADRELDRKLSTAGARAALSLMTGGGVFIEILELLRTRKMPERQSKWEADLDRRLTALSQHVSGITPEGLADNDTFVTTLANATEIARRNHQEEKLQALQNAVLNAAMPSALEDDLQLMFLSFVDTLTPTHLRILKFLNDPVAWMRGHAIELPPNPALSGKTLISYVMPEIDIWKGYFSGVPDELQSRGLLDVEWNKETTYRFPGTRGGSRTTALCKAFLSFIDDPLESQE